MIWGILGALDEEIVLIKDKMVVESQTSLYGRIFYKGTIYDKKVVLACCGIGKVNATMCATALINIFNCTQVINVGIAGATGSGLNVLDIVLSQKTVFHDQDAVMLKYYPKTEFFRADANLLNLAKSVCDNISDVNYRVGLIATGDVFVNNNDIKSNIINKYNPDCVEMEGCAIAHVCSCSDIPFLIIRCMSDSADDSAKNTYDNFLELSANKSATIILNMLKI